MIPQCHLILMTELFNHLCFIYTDSCQNQVYSLLLRVYKWEQNQSTFNNVAFWRTWYSLWLKYLYQSRALPKHPLWAKHTHMCQVTSFHFCLWQGLQHEPTYTSSDMPRQVWWGGRANPLDSYLHRGLRKHLGKNTALEIKNFFKTNLMEEQSSSHMSTTLLSFRLAFWPK